MHRLDGKIALIRMGSSSPRLLLSSARRLQPTTRFATPACATGIWSPSEAWGTAELKERDISNASRLEQP
jgi:hypothetical protein